MHTFVHCRSRFPCLFFAGFSLSLGISWWPHGEWEDFYSASFFALWIFVWDDTIDANDHDLSENFQKACHFRSQTLKYCKYYLGLSEDSEEPELPSLACSLFKEFAGRIVEKFQKRRHLERMILAASPHLLTSPILNRQDTANL